MEVSTLERLLAVERQRDGSVTGRCLVGARGRIFGGQVAAQALRAASLAAPSGRDPHSLHCSFLRPGDPSRDVMYDVTVIRDGRSLTTSRVDAHQGERTILTALASFHVAESSPDYQRAAPQVGDAETLAESAYVPPGSNGEVRMPFEFRYVDAAATADTPAPASQRTWLRARGRLPDDVGLHACALVYASDLTLTRTAHMPLRRTGTTRMGSSLDHSVWFHRSFRADSWLLFDQETPSYAGARALSHGQFFDTAGVLVASVSQEALILVRPEG